MVNVEHEITRRERRMVMRTAMDLLRFVPFAVLAAIPGGSVGIVFLAKFMPSSLPSTFHVPNPEELRKLTYEGEKKFQKHMNGDLRRAIGSMVNSMHKNQVREYTHIQRLIEHVQDGIPSDDPSFVLSYSKLTETEFLDLLNTQQLTKLAEYFHFESMLSFDTYQYSILRYRLQRHLSNINADDIELFYELRSHKLSPNETLKACYERGLITREQLESENVVEYEYRLTLWLHNSQIRHIPAVLQAFSNFHNRF